MYCLLCVQLLSDTHTVFLQRMVVSGGGGGAGGGGGGMVGGGGGGGYKPHIQLPNPTGPGVQTIQFPVPSNKCGLIIGKGECSLIRAQHL